MELEALLIERGKNTLSRKRWQHSLRTADYTGFLHNHYSLEPGSIRIAALAHDLAREWDVSLIKEAALKDQESLSRYNLTHPVLLHGFAAAWLLQSEYAVTDPSVLNAVRYHSTGHPVLDRAGLIVFAADYMEPGRKHLDDDFRSTLLDKSLEGMILTILEAMELFLNSKNLPLSPDSRELYQKLSKGYNQSL